MGGYWLHGAGDGWDGLAMTEQKGPDLVILDLLLPPAVVAGSSVSVDCREGSWELLWIS